MAKKWEYLTQQFYGNEFSLTTEEDLNTWGKEGWELVAVTKYKPTINEMKEIAELEFAENSSCTAFFKREIQ